MMTMTTERTGTTVGAQGLEREEMPVSISLSEYVEPSEQRSRPQKRGREEADDKGGKVVKYWNCTRKKVECIWPR